MIFLLLFINKIKINRRNLINIKCITQTQKDNDRMINVYTCTLSKGKN